MPTFAPAQTDLRCAASVGRILRDPQYLRGLADRQTLVVCREESRLFPGSEDAARRMERRAGDVGHILAPQWELDRRPVDGAVPGLVGEPQHGVGDAAFGALRRKLANPVLHLLQAPSDDADDIDADLRMAMDQVEQLGLAPARLERFGEGDRVGGIAAIGEERDRPEHLAGPDEADDDLGAVAAGLGDAHATLDHRVGAHTVVALAEDAKILRQAPHARASGDPCQGRGRESAEKLHRGKGLRDKLRVGDHERRLPVCIKEREVFAPAQTGRAAAAVRLRQIKTGSSDGSSGMRPRIRGFSGPAGARKAVDDVVIARALHVLFVVIWIGGVSMATSVVLPAVRRGDLGENRLAAFQAIERRFAWQARTAIVVVGLTGFYMVWRLDLWDRFRTASFWWMHAMVCLWLLFAFILFIARTLYPAPPFSTLGDGATGGRLCLAASGALGAARR